MSFFRRSILEISRPAVLLDCGQAAWRAHRETRKTPRQAPSLAEMVQRAVALLGPGQRQKIGEKQIREFAKELGTTLDALDFGLVVAAHNEIMSGGSIRAALDTGPENKPAIHQTHVVRIKDITPDREGRLAVTMARGPLEIVPNDIEKDPRKLKGPVMVRGLLVPVLTATMVNEQGQPINLTNFETTLQSLMPTKKDQLRMKRRMRKLGFRLKIEQLPKQADLPSQGRFAGPITLALPGPLPHRIDGAQVDFMRVASEVLRTRATWPPTTSRRRSSA